MPIAHANNIEIWYETFGNKNDEAILLIMGACCQGILWPTEFCEMLANEGFYVIRYDHRDTGESTYFDFEKNPYNIEDMALDAIELLNFLKIEKFQLVGLSMGGPIAELISLSLPNRTIGMTLIATSCDFRPGNLAFAGKPAEQNSLSRTKDIYLEWMNAFLSKPPITQEDHIKLRVEGWGIMSGDKVPFEEDRYYELHREFLERARHLENHLNHIKICQTAEETIRTIPFKVIVPTVVIQGSEDPLFQKDHGEALAKAIKNSKYVLIEGLGHVPNKHFYRPIIEQIKFLQKCHLPSEID